MSKSKEKVMGLEKMHVAVGKDIAENWLILKWALNNAKGKQVSTIHVHQHGNLNTTPRKEKSFEERLSEKIRNSLQKYEAGVEELYIEADSIEKGIVQHIKKHKIGVLVMGAAAEEHSSTMRRSKKAVYVMDNAPLLCHIMFICNGKLIYTHQKVPIRDLPESSPSKNTPAGAESNEGAGSPNTPSIAESRVGAESPNTPSRAESREGAGSPNAPSGNETESIINEHYYNQLEHAMIEAENSRRVAFEESVRRRKAEKEAFCDAINKAETAARLYDEELRLRKATEKELAVRQGEVDIGKEELEFINKLWNKVTEELRETTAQKFSLQNQIEKTNVSLKESEEKLFSTLEVLQKYKDEQEELRIESNKALTKLEKERNKALNKAEKERDKALKEVDKLRKQLDQGQSSSHVPGLIPAFSHSDLEKATKHFDPCLKIGEGGYGSIYRGFLRHTEVAIKILNPKSVQGPREFDQEVAVLSKLRHPNLVTLFGACQESWALVYVYLPGGNLEDRLFCKNNTLPLPWQIRIRIATELCTALLFLHTSRPGCIIHGDLKPSNVLLDDNCVSKLSDFGICRVVPNGEISTDRNTFILNTQPKGTLMYIDPEFLSTGELTPQSDVYSFGIILLQLLTRKSALGITKEVQSALARDSLSSILDTSAGDWPFVQAERLARIALRCCDMHRKNRPDLASNVWRVLEPMKASCQKSYTFRGEFANKPPNYFICPISQEIMEDPHIASDGFTYEAKAIRGWLNSGHDSSPMTNMKLANLNLIPNRALRSSVQEWLQHNRSA